MKTEQILADLTAELKADNDKAELKAALRAIDEMYKDSLVSWVAKSNPTVCYDRANDRIGVTVNGKTSFKQEMMMLDNLLILCLGGAVVCAIFVIFELIAKWRDWS